MDGKAHLIFELADDLDTDGAGRCQARSNAPAQKLEDRVYDLTRRSSAPTIAPGFGKQQRVHDRPFRISQTASMAQLRPV